MKFHTALKFIVGHVLAGAVIILGTLLVALVCYVIGLERDPNGIATPVAEFVFFISFMFMVGVFAVAVSTGAFVISTFLQWLRSKRPFPVWLPFFAVPILTFFLVLMLARGKKDMAFVEVVTATAFVYFGIYWCLLTSSSFLLDYLRRKFTRQKIP